jgi:Tfp pilus assembly protein PilV
MKRTTPGKPRCGSSCSGIALTEVIMSMGIAAVGIGCIISGYVLAVQEAELSACSAAVHWRIIETLERTRSARWQPLAPTPVDELVEGNFPTSVTVLDIPQTRTKVVYATNRTTITSLTGYSTLKMIRVESVWACLSRGPFTNSVTTYRSADR